MAGGKNMCPECGIAFSDEEGLRRHGRDHERGSMGRPGEMHADQPFGKS